MGNLYRVSFDLIIENLLIEKFRLQVKSCFSKLLSKLYSIQMREIFTWLYKYHSVYCALVGKTKNGKLYFG